MDSFQPEPPRSAIPKVIGILMIIFGALVFFGNGFSLIGRGDVPHGSSVYGTLSKISLIFNLIDITLGGFQAYVGIRLLSYKDTAPKQAHLWAAGNIVSTILYMILMFLWLKPKMAGLGPMAEAMVGFSVIVKAIFAVGWSVVVSVLCATSGAKTSCTNY